MKAVLLETVDRPVVVEDLELLPLGRNEVRVQVGASGVCHSDLSLRRGQYGLPTPLVMGHEGAGTVVEVGPDVTMTRPGDRVVASFTAACGTCWQCARSRSHLCERNGEFRTAAAGLRGGREVRAFGGLGTMAEILSVDEHLVIPVETTLPFEQLALVGCAVTTGAGSALFAAGVQPGATVAVIGCGGVGMSAIQGARAAGAAQIVAVDPLESKRRLAKGFGATDSVDPTAPDALERLRALTDGRGVEVAIEVAGRIEAMRFAYDATCRGGTAVFVGALDRSVELPLPANDIHATAKRVVGTLYGGAQVRRDIPRLVAMAEGGRLDLAGLVTRRVPLDEADAALDAIEGGEVIRSVLIMEEP